MGIDWRSETLFVLGPFPFAIFRSFDPRVCPVSPESQESDRLHCQHMVDICMYTYMYVGCSAAANNSIENQTCTAARRDGDALVLAGSGQDLRGQDAPASATVPSQPASQPVSQQMAYRCRANRFAILNYYVNMKIIEATGIQRWLANLFISLNLGYGSWVESSTSSASLSAGTMPSSAVQGPIDGGTNSSRSGASASRLGHRLPFRWRVHN